VTDAQSSKESTMNQHGSFVVQSVALSEADRLEIDHHAAVAVATLFAQMNRGLRQVRSALARSPFVSRPSSTQEVASCAGYVTANTT